MSNNRLFTFVEKFSGELVVLASRIEDQLFEQPQTSLMQARLYSEQLVKLVSVEEELEKIYPLKHSERIHKLYRNNAIEEDIYLKLEWLRKKGNKAAHDVKGVEIQDVLQAHKFLFDISVWYMQVYISYDFEAPIYKLPVKTNQDSAAIDVKDLDTLIKPYLDQTLRKIDDMWSEVNRELEAIKKEKEQLQIDSLVNKPIAVENESKVKEFSLFEYLNDHDLEYIDKRDKKGDLWIIGDWSINEKLFPLKSHKIYFRFAKKGSRITGYQPAWFLLNKNATVMAPEQERNASIGLEKCTQAEEVKVEIVPPNQEGIPSPMIEIKHALSDYWKAKGQMLIPVYLLEALMQDWPLKGIKALLEYQKVTMFSEMSDDVLRLVYKNSQADFYQVMTDLYWLGFRFTGNLTNFQPVSTNRQERQILVLSKKSMDISSMLPRHLSTKLKAKLVDDIQDLNHVLVSSLDFLFKEDADYVLKLLEERMNGNVHYSATLDENDRLIKEPIDVLQIEKISKKAQIMYNGQALLIEGALTDTPITEIGIIGCNHLLNELNRLGIKSLAELTEPIDDIYLKMTSVGPRTVEKFWNQLLTLSEDKNEEQGQADENEFGDKVIMYDGNEIMIQEELKDKELRPNDFPGCENALKTMIQNGIDTYGQLPRQFSKIGELKGIGKTKVRRIFQRLPLTMEAVLQEERINQLSEAERLQFELKSFEKWFKCVSDSEKEARNEKVSPRYIKLMNDRFHAFLKGEHVTLEVLGKQEGVTRERIRQIFAKGDQRVCDQISMIKSLIQQRLEAQGGINVDDVFDHNKTSHYVLKSALETEKIYSTNIGTTPIITLHDHHELNAYRKDIHQEVQTMFALRVVTEADIKAYSLERSTEDNVPESIIYDMASEMINWLSIEQGVLRNMKKSDAVEMVMLQFPDGVEVYKREDELIEKANDLMPGSFEGERSFNSVIIRDEMAERIVLWGRGTYIHIRFITDDEEWIHSIQDLAEKWLEQEDFIHVLKLYSHVEDQAKYRNIPNEYALYSLLRRYTKGTLSLTRFPMIMLEGIDRQANHEWIIQYIAEQSAPVPLEELLDVFVNNRGWKRFTLEFNLSNTSEIIQYEYGSYTLLSNYDHIKDEDIAFIISAITHHLTDKPLISVHAIFEENKPLLKSLGIETSRLLYALLRRIGHSNAKITRYPYIVSSDFHIDVISCRKFVEDFIREQQDIVPREEVDEWIQDLFGQNGARILDIALIQSNDILYYSKGRYGEYIHRDTIRMYGETEQLVQEKAQAKYEEMKRRKDREYVLLKELFDQSILPTLGSLIPWSMELLGDILKKSNQWTMIGSYDEILLPAGGAIANDIDFIEYALTHHFGGAVKCSQLQMFLSNIRYSKQGNLLTGVKEAIMNDTAPYSEKGDELIHFDLMGGK